MSAANDDNRRLALMAWDAAVAAWRAAHPADGSFDPLAVRMDHLASANWRKACDAAAIVLPGPCAAPLHTAYGG